MLRKLLTTWETWSARNTLNRALSSASTHQARGALTRSLADTPEVDPLDALRDATELVGLLQGWQWQVVYDARQTGASWTDIASALGVSVERAKSDYVAAIDRQEHYGMGNASSYRDVVDGAV